MSDDALPNGSVDLSGKVALITGTTSGFGERFARVLAGVGAKVVLTGRRVDRLEALKAELEAKGKEVLAIPLDVTDAASIEACVAASTEHFGQIDILINNAGMNVEGPALELSADDLDRILDTNLRSVFLMSREVAKGMVKRGGAGGRIVNIASMGAYKVLPGLAAYCATKAAVVTLTRAFAREWARHDLTVNAICPGYIETEINAEWFQTELGRRQIKSFPRRRLGDVSDLDSSLLMLVSPQSHFITGSTIDVNDAQSL
jgi:NAD(P)-dependent dehydrogenase (short-subunit alcohol dehydrogenase family)